MATMLRTWLLVALALVVVASAFALAVTAAPPGGQPRPAKALSITLYGSMTGGWGF